MTPEEALQILKPGDILIYWTPCLADWIITFKTWSRWCGHIEFYEGNGRSTAARAEGVNEYPLRLDGLQYVRRPKVRPGDKWDFARGRAWFEKEAKGCGYAWLSLLSFAAHKAITMAHSMFCSDYATQRLRATNFAPFDPAYPSQMVPPDYFIVSPMFETAWQRYH